MNQIERFHETLAMYRKHGWRLERVLMRPDTLAQLGDQQTATFEGLPVREAAMDAMWFARPSHAGREAWELRLVSDPPYALFETFEADEAEEEREDVRREMEARLRQRAGAGE
jgi:hypothetical protein